MGCWFIYYAVTNSIYWIWLASIAILPLHTTSTFCSDDGGDTRSTRVRWVPQNTQWWWLYEKLGNMAILSNTTWDFDVYSVPDQLQYTSSY